MQKNFIAGSDRRLTLCRRRRRHRRSIAGLNSQDECDLNVTDGSHGGAPLSLSEAVERVRGFPWPAPVCRRQLLCLAVQGFSEANLRELQALQSQASSREQEIHQIAQVCAAPPQSPIVSSYSVFYCAAALCCCSSSVALLAGWLAGWHRCLVRG